MREVIIKKLIKFINNGSYSKEELEKIKYGLECIYIFITKGIVIFTIAYFLGILKYTLAFVALYGIIRSFACGLHATKSWICMISSILIFIIIPYLCHALMINYLIKFSLMIIATTLIYVYAPADTKKRPIINKNKRKKLKFISTGISTIYILINLYIKNNFLTNALMFSLILEAIMILPITYKIFKLPYNNYVNYLKAHKLEGRI